MCWIVDFYDGVEEDILSMPPKIQARMFRLLELIEEHGANLGEPHTKSMGDGLLRFGRKPKKESGAVCFVI
ncbi:type II toxin-antitoxin system RelE/ParE family toxin [Vibrio sp. PP-XX7]